MHRSSPLFPSVFSALVLVGVAACGWPWLGGNAPPSAPPVASPQPVSDLPVVDGGTDGAEGLALSAPPTEEETAGAQESEEIDDGAESPALEGPGQAYRHPLDGWTKEQIENALVKNPESLGSMSIGYTNSGALFNGVQMPTADAWDVMNPGCAWGTRETIDYLIHSLNRVGELYPGSPRMFIGHISGRRGGHLAPHKSHQAGRDVDVSYYYVAGQERWYATATAQNLDRERTWAFIKTIVADTDVQLILMDRAVQRLVRQHALARGEDREWVDQLFDGAASLPPLIRHAKGHATHLHVRFYNPLAQETGRRSYEILIQRNILRPPSYFVRHKVKQGDSLSELAQKYGVPAKTIQQVNGLKTDVLKIGREYKIPHRGGVKACPKVAIPARRVPPDASAVPRAQQRTVPEPTPAGGT